MTPGGPPASALVGLERLPFEVAVVDATGTIVAVNERWRRFADENHGRDPDHWVGANYFEVCEQADDPLFADRVVAGLREVLAGERDHYREEYPCHSPREQRWFQLDASRFVHGDDPYLAVVHVDVTDRKLAEVRAEARAEQLETIIEILTHDLRNPLNVIAGYVDLLAADLGDSEELDTIRQAIIRVTEITEATLSFTRSGALSTVEPLDVGELARTAWRSVPTGSASLRIEGTQRIHGDRQLLLQLFENLFRNSVEHAGSDCTVTLGAVGDGFYVEDDGPGIPAPLRERAVRADYSTQGAGGMGLAIVQAVVHAHGGRLVITDADEGGARFEVTGFDVAPEAPAVDPDDSTGTDAEGSPDVDAEGSPDVDAEGSPDADAGTSADSSAGECSDAVDR